MWMGLLSYINTDVLKRGHFDARESIMPPDSLVQRALKGQHTNSNSLDHRDVNCQPSVVGNPLHSSNPTCHQQNNDHLACCVV
jgi:hypothetical protein